MRDLKGKVAVVTGAASGIGRAMAERFAREGMKVVLADVEKEPLEEAARAIAKSGTDAWGVLTDVSKREDVEALARKSFELCGEVHVLCNNAGVGAGGMSWDQPLGDWEWTINVNLWGVIHGIRAFVPRMVEQGQGHVVNTASMAGLCGLPGTGAYCASKHAVVAISECLFHELGFATGGKVKVSVLCPGWVKTNIADAERNRPANLKGEAGAGQRSPQEQMMEAMLRQAIANGMPPSDVADMVLAAIHEERFWILTHPSMKKIVEARARGILEGLDPRFDPTAL
jgi:NAD(P)-dependent dehydrogenase (short-subunit alcohol dehydrogenase family)